MQYSRENVALRRTMLGFLNPLATYMPCCRSKTRQGYLANATQASYVDLIRSLCFSGQIFGRSLHPREILGAEIGAEC